MYGRFLPALRLSNKLPHSCDQVNIVTGLLINSFTDKFFCTIFTHIKYGFNKALLLDNPKFEQVSTHL